MTIADKLTLLANTKEALRTKLKLAKSVPFSKYPDYVNWITAPSIPNKAFYADFTNDRYVKDGVPCNFKDLFTFSRAGKAWLVKDTGLQEYAADVPRLDNGLLIEQSATCLNGNSFLDVELSSTSEGVSKVGSGITRTQDMRGYFYPRPYAAASVTCCLSAWRLTGDVFYEMVADGQVLYSLTSKSNVDYCDFPSLALKNTGLRWDDLLNKSGNQYSAAVAFAFQVEVGILPTSPIKTITSPVTRPADFLLNKITGTTVTGDWDSTLNLSIVNGNLVHSGYGRIRSLEIN